MSTALYRRYRPESFADVIGQEHVTEPLMQALRSERVNHAYLFSGPRGCGKTTSARILARCLNCEQGPTPTPCGTCESCVALARGGPGSVDVIEIDAASHGGVDDARDLRERAAFGPATARYKVYIIDEAHMVTPNGFNALLKVVEEPPPHVKFIFATTEPEKVLATIRSRTHHYPFHLVPPQRLTAYLEELCTAEGVSLEPGVLSFVTRAGGGSVRDSLSVLDQLISGAGDQGLTYERTAALLGFTDVELLDAVVEAVAAGDAATVFDQVDRVMESGHDPRRFAEDLLERYRDLIVLAAVGEQAGGLLPGLPEDQVERMRRQAQAYGSAGLSRAGDLVSRGLSEMTGAVSYRLMLELLAARLLLPAAAGEDGYGARLDRIERRLGAQGEEPTPARRPARAAVPPAQQEAAPEAAQVPEREETQESAPPPQGPSPDEPPRPRPGHLDTAAMRRHWPEIITAVRAISARTAGALESMQVLDFDGGRLLVGMPDERWIRHFMGTSNEEALRQGVLDALALEVRIEATTLGGGPQGGGQEDPEPPDDEPGGEHPPAAEPPDEPDTEPRPQQAAPPPVGLPDAPPRGRIRTRADQSGPAPVQPVATAPTRVRGRGAAAAGGPAATPASTDADLAEQLGAVGGRSADSSGQPEWAQASRSGDAAPDWATGASAPASAPAAAGSGAAAAATSPAPSGDAPSEDDEDLTTSGAVGQPVIETVLGGTVIAINDDPVA
ncbi:MULTISPECIES: DNA polymerase III subunit gamma and tau [unclassified Serinicoccus]|uniref:DNA polymerase III subunit gamma and tau n=1 Tax=unclassified Serinicoccus TaxID=2643101 RepID=UPI0038541E03